MSHDDPFSPSHLLASGWARSPGSSPAVDLTAEEGVAVIGLGLRPTYSIVPCDDHEGAVELMVANAVLWMQAAEITSAGKARRLRRELWGQATSLLDEAIPEARGDMERAVSDRDRWRAGETAHGFPDLGLAATEAMYGELIAAGGHLFNVLEDVAAKIDRSRRLVPA